MCGIYAVLQLESESENGNAAQKVFAGIKRIEYRGYDSWGVASLDEQVPGGEIVVQKRVGKIGSAGEVHFPQVSAAVGHTRWATHGGVTHTNAHPHLAQSGEFAVVHNGVVENYAELKKQLEKKGYVFKTQTDTETIVGLLELAAQNQPLTEKVFHQCVSNLQGRSTVAVLTKQGTIFAFRYGSPLVVAHDKTGSLFLSSDVLSVSLDATHFYSAKHGEVLVLSQGVATVSPLGEVSQGAKNLAMKVVFAPITIKATALDTGGYEHFMLKEIMEQPEAVIAPVSAMSQSDWEKLLTRLQKSTKIFVIGAGSASFAAGFVAAQLRKAGRDARDVRSYEARSYITQLTKTDTVIALSQSGETADTLEAVEWAKDQGATLVSLVNMAGSTLAAMSDLSFSLAVGPEVGVGSTKAMTAMMSWGFAVAQGLAGKKQAEVVKNLELFGISLKKWLDNKNYQVILTNLVKLLVKHEHLYVLGRGDLSYSALEFALKMKEISYIHAEGFSGGELKHGVIALIEKGTPVVCLVADDDERADMLSAAAEVRARGAHVIGISETTSELFDTWLPVPKGFGALSAIATIIPSQLLTYYLARKKNLDPDKPRNLAKSVTVK